MGSGIKKTKNRIGFNQTIMYLSLLYYPVQTLGIGNRIGIWFQGCDFACKGCISTHTWKKTEDTKTDLQVVLKKCEHYFRYNPEGITISGGEPFDQPEVLYKLLLGIRAMGINDVMLYSGYKYEYLKKNYSHILALIDILIDGKFEEGLESEYIWKGSENQNMIFLTSDEKLINKYSEYKNLIEEKRKLQLISTKAELVHIIGIPKQKDARIIKNGL